jgi:hypothetical protein
MDDVIARVSKYGATLANGAPHQQQIGQDILLVVGALAAEQGKSALVEITPYLWRTGQAQPDKEVRDQVDKLKALSDPEMFSDEALEVLDKMLTDGAALVSASHEQFGTSIEEVVDKMVEGGILAPNITTRVAVSEHAPHVITVEKIEPEDMLIDPPPAKKTRKKG